MTETEVVASPCVNVCELNEVGDCLGCGRSLDEIAIWGQASNEERLEILKAAAVRVTQAAG